MGRRLTSGRLLAIGAAVLVAVVALLVYQLEATSAAPAPSPSRDVAIRERATTAERSFQHAVAKVAEQQASVPAGKLDPQSDAFYERFERAVPRAVSGPAMRNCYHGGLGRQDRDASITVEFVDHVVNGEVTISDVRVKKSTLTDKALEACMVKEIGAARFHDDALPDWKQDDEVVITPERVFHKYMDDDSYQGPAAPANTPR